MTGVIDGETVWLTPNTTPAGTVTSYRVVWADRPEEKGAGPSRVCSVAPTRGDGTRNLRGGYPVMPVCWGARFVKGLMARGELVVE